MLNLQEKVEGLSYGQEMEEDSRQGSLTQNPQKREGAGHKGEVSRLQEAAAERVAYDVTSSLGTGCR